MQAEFDETLSIDTPERVNLDFAVAGIGSRALAYFVDSFLLFVAWVLFLFILNLLPFQMGKGKSIMIFLLLSIFLTQYAYFLLFEALWGGQTPGKRLCGIRVMMEEGLPLTFFASAIRNLLRIIDFLPASYGLGLLCMFFHPQSRRFGDIAARTLVIRESFMSLEALTSQFTQVSNTETALSPLAARVSLGLSDYNLISDFLHRSTKFEPARRYRLAQEIARPYLERGEINADELNQAYSGAARYERFLRECVKIYLGKTK